MKLLAMVLMGAVFVGVALRCAAAQACAAVAVEASVEAGPGELTLAGLLARGACAQWREAAAQVRLGAVPRAGSVRVLDGREIRRMLERLEGAGLSLGKIGGAAIPERIVVKRRGVMKSCAEIARFVAGSVGDVQNAPSQWRVDLDCAGARGIPEAAPLELAKSGWSAARERWEFALHCARPRDCVPFMVWGREPKTAVGSAESRSGAMRQGSASGSAWRVGDGASGAERLVKAGETVTLTWDQAGIRVILPVTCLDAGGLGQVVRVRLKNAARILRAEVVGEGTLRASL
jgi:flagellar basal body P-ring formation chaperone FlgA